MSEWIEINGGSKAWLVETGTEIQVRCRDGDIVSTVLDEYTAPTAFEWFGRDSDWMAYRVITPALSSHDPVNKPSHYMLFPEQNIEFIDVRDVLIERLKDFSPKQIDYWSRAFEYLARAGGKNGVEDIKKAKWYLDRLVASLEEQK
jgi:hypothetical protein